MIAECDKFENMCKCDCIQFLEETQIMKIPVLLYSISYPCISKYTFTLIKSLTITYQYSVQRTVQYTSSNDDHGDHDESYESSKHYSPF